MERRSRSLVRNRWLRLVVLLSLCLTPTSAQTAGPQRCGDMVVSPSFITDGTAYCARIVRTSGSATGVLLLRTTDRGRSWERAQAAGITLYPSETSPSPALRISPLYEQDGMLFLAFGDSGLFVSSDRGETFRPVNPLGGYGVTSFVMSSAADRRSVMFAQAAPGPSEGANYSALIDASTGVRVPVTGTPGNDRAFAIPPGYDSHEQAFAIGEFGVGSQRHFEIFRCGPNFACIDRIKKFPQGVEFDRMWFSGRFSSNGVAFLSGRDSNGRHFLWRSTDGGTTFTRWRSLERLLAPLHRPVKGRENLPFHSFGLAPVPKTNVVYLRTYFSAQIWDRFPRVTLHRSNDTGKTWRRVAFGRPRDHKLAVGRMPVLGDTDGPQLGSVAEGYVLAPTAKDVFIIGSDQRRYTGAPSEDTYMVACSRNGGRTWDTPCGS